MTLDFQINQDYLIAHTLVSTDANHFSSQEYKQDVVAFQDHAWVTKVSALFTISLRAPNAERNPNFF